MSCMSLESLVFITPRLLKGLVATVVSLSSLVKVCVYRVIGMDSIAVRCRSRCPVLLKASISYFAVM